MACLIAPCSFTTVRHTCRPLTSSSLLRLGQRMLPMLFSLIIKYLMCQPLALEHQARGLSLR